MNERRMNWDDLPIKCGEDGDDYLRLYARFSHVGCPGYQFEDNCSAPWDCASKGRCRVSFERNSRQRRA
jgi:hypothetical protein